MGTHIHPTAIIEKGAELDEGVTVGPFSIINSEVRLAKNVSVASNVIIEGNTEVGEDTTLHHFACLGLAPQDTKYSGEKTGLKIGRGNIIREFATLHRASVGGEGFTMVGDNCFLMAYTHVAHDCRIGNNVTMANAVTLAGHVTVEDNAVIGGLSAIHQFTRIGTHAMVGGFSAIAQDVPPYTIVSGPRAKLYGLNSIGLRRHGLPNESIQELKKAYMIIFRSDKRNLKEALKKVQEELPYTDEIATLVEFINANKRGICR